jgi:S-adenosylmethionine-diacylgycerolhomoserine-N-methlytransferase
VATIFEVPKVVEYWFFLRTEKKKKQMFLRDNVVRFIGDPVLALAADNQQTLDNALSLLRPGGLLGVVDFYVSEASPPAGATRHGAFDRFFWPRWFAHDGVRPCPDHLRRLQELLPDHVVEERRAPVPYLPGLRVPYYLFIGRKAGT